MAKIYRMERGRLSKQFFKTKEHGRSVTRGPYYVLQRWFVARTLPAYRASGG
jgi:hypothetical protein